MSLSSSSRSNNPSENESHKRRAGYSNTATGSSAHIKAGTSMKRLLEVDLKRLEIVDRNPTVPPEVRQISSMLMYGLPMAVAWISGQLGDSPNKPTSNSDKLLPGVWVTGGIVVIMQLSTAWSRFMNKQNQPSYQLAKQQVDAILTNAARSAANKVCQDIRETLPISSNK